MLLVPLSSTCKSITALGIQILWLNNSPLWFPLWQKGKQLDSVRANDGRVSLTCIATAPRGWDQGFIQLVSMVWYLRRLSWPLKKWKERQNYLFKNRARNKTLFSWGWGQQDKIISSLCGVILGDQYSCLLPPSWIRLQTVEERMALMLGQPPGQPALLGNWKKELECSCVCKRSWHSGVPVVPTLGFLEDAFFPKKGEKE